MDHPTQLDAILESFAHHFYVYFPLTLTFRTYFRALNIYEEPALYPPRMFLDGLWAGHVWLNFHNSSMGGRIS